MLVAMVVMMPMVMAMMMPMVPMMSMPVRSVGSGRAREDAPECQRPGDNQAQDDAIHDSQPFLMRTT